MRALLFSIWVLLFRMGMAQPIAIKEQFDYIDQKLIYNGTYGTNARKTVGTIHAFWAGDVTFNKQIKFAGGSNDRDPILVRIGGTVPTATVNGYFSEDVNMTGQVKYAGSSNDRDPILVNIGGKVPTATRSEQLP